jgi:16S rRNA (cytosine967-C5)-methyltransferase
VRRLTARDVASRVVARVERDRAFTAAALDAELERAGLEPRDRALATELAYGAVRSRGALIARLERFAPRGLGKLEPDVRATLLVAAYQLVVLDRVPAFAAVNEAVNAIHERRGGHVAGFANAVLRRLAESGERLGRDEAALESLPGWLRARLEQAVGPHETRALVGADEPRATVRVRPGATPPAWLEGAERGRASPLALSVRGAGDLKRREGYAEGAFVVQEEGAQVVGLGLGARPGERVLDACAGRGQKASLLAEQIGERGELWATDLHAEKLRALELELTRLHLPPARVRAVDWTQGSEAVPRAFDRVLVDAPCSGVGTLRRRPEIAGRLEPDDPRRLAELALSILRGAAVHARPGGRVLFAVCSVLPKESANAVERVGDLLEPAPFDAPELAPLLEPGATSLRLLPLRHGTEGYFVASFVRR